MTLLLALLSLIAACLTSSWARFAEIVPHFSMVGLVQNSGSQSNVH